jgi:hypothetical protein
VKFLYKGHEPASSNVTDPTELQPGFWDFWEVRRFILLHEWVSLPTEFGLDIRFFDHLYTRLGTTSNYSTTANLHHLQITTERLKSFPAGCVFTSLVTASNSGDSSASSFKSFLIGGSLPADPFLHRLIWLPQLSSLKLLGTDCVDNTVNSLMCIRCRANVFASPSNGLHNPVC